MCVCVRSIRNSCCYRKGDKIHKWAHRFCLNLGGIKLRQLGPFGRKELVVPPLSDFLISEHQQRDQIRGKDNHSRAYV